MALVVSFFLLLVPLSSPYSYPHIFRPGGLTVPRYPLSTLTKPRTRLYGVGLGPPADSSPSSNLRYDVIEDAVTCLGEEIELSQRYRISEFDSNVDKWFGQLLNPVPASLHPVQLAVLKKLTQKPAVEPIPPEWAPERNPYNPTHCVQQELAYGCETFNIPLPRRKAEAWRFFDLEGMTKRNFTNKFIPGDKGGLSDADLVKIAQELEGKKVFLESDDISARLVYVDDTYVPSLSKPNKYCYHTPIERLGDLPPHLLAQFERLPDAASDFLPYKNTTKRNPIPISCLSGVDHMLGSFNSMFAVNTQQGTACFAALNTVRCSSIGVVDIAPDVVVDKPIQLVRLYSENGKDKAAMHPRMILHVGDNSHVDILQTSYGIDGAAISEGGPTLYNSYTQVQVGENSSLNHSYVEEVGGQPVSHVESSFDERKKEEMRVPNGHTYMETIDAQLFGRNSKYRATILATGGCGRSRLCFGATVMEEESHVEVKGLTLSGGMQRVEIKTNIHHIAAGCTSEQAQRSVVAGRSQTNFKGRIRVEQSSQQLASEQLSRSLLLSDSAKVNVVPSLEIIADDVTCTHGATVSDLSQEELFYLRSRGLDKQTSRSLQIQAFVDDMTGNVPVTFLGDRNFGLGLKSRVLEKLQGMAPVKDREVAGEFQSI